MSVKKPAAKTSAAKKPESKKPPAKKPPTTTPTAPAPAADDDLHTSAYVLTALVARTAAGPAIGTEQVLFYIDAPQNQLVAMGQEVRTERINLDSARLYGTALDFYQAATPEQRAAVPGLTAQRLRVSIWAAAQGEAKNAAALAAEEHGAAEQDYRAIDAKQVKDKARGIREVLDATLFALAAGHKLRLEQLRVAYGRSASAKDLANSLTALADQCDRYLADPDPKITARRDEMKLDRALPDQARAMAKQVLTRAGAATAPRTAVSNADVDLWDGINLQLLDQLITIFEAGHTLEPTVPRLLPLSLRGWFGRSRTTKAAAPEPQPAPSPPAA